LPRSWEYPEVASARIVLEGREYRATDFVETTWRQVANVTVHGEAAGWVEVVYVEERPPRDEGPFLASERALLNAIAERLGHIVERLRAEARLEEREVELRGRLTHLARVGEVGEMASSIAHEVNQPLTAIATYAQAGRRLAEAGSLDTDATVDLLSRIAEDALRAGAIIHRLRDLVRRQDLKQVHCDVNALVQAVTHLAAVDARLHDVTLTLDLAKELPVVLADGIQVQQVVLNLVRNAIDAMAGQDAAARALVVRSRQNDDGHVVVSVEDNGCGLPDDAENNLFQPFFTTKEGGMGMGLSISRTIAAAHGGQLWFERKPTGGTIFHLELPPANEDRDESN
jgi:two-component system sensor kinase FixL